MISDIQKEEYQDLGLSGLPDHYPSPTKTDKLLFYIQRNHNLNTVIYEVNYTAQSEQINRNYPMHAYWLKYTAGGEIEELNYYQNKMAYGYDSRQLSSNSFSFNFVSYKELTLYVGLNKNDNYHVCCSINQEMSVLNNIYVYAEELGVFPNVKFIELFGTHLKTQEPTYQRINIDS